MVESILINIDSKMKRLPLKAIQNGIYHLTLHGESSSHIIASGELDVASVLHGVPRDSSLLIEHKPGLSEFNQRLQGNKPAIHFRNIGYIFSGEEKHLVNEIKYLAEIARLYRNVKSFDSFFSALKWAEMQ